jgi:hypothetical protein
MCASCLAVLVRFSMISVKVATGFHTTLELNNRKWRAVIKTVARARSTQGRILPGTVA